MVSATTTSYTQTAPPIHPVACDQGSVRFWIPIPTEVPAGIHDRSAAGACCLSRRQDRRNGWRFAAPHVPTSGRENRRRGQAAICLKASRQQGSLALCYYGSLIPLTARI